jgi:hypothetical protein
VPPRPELRFVKELIRTEKCGLYKDFYCLKADLLLGVGYEEFGELEEGLGRFRAHGRRENPTEGVEQRSKSNL